MRTQTANTAITRIHHKTMKHIDTRDMWMNDHVKANNVKRVNILTAQNVADKLFGL
jgi:hypothetical protein